MVAANFVYLTGLFWPNASREVINSSVGSFYANDDDRRGSLQGFEGVLSIET